MPDDKTFTRLDWLASSVQNSDGSLEDIATEFTRKAILFGHFLPGQRLPQDRIAEALGMSRMPVRGALYRLESEELIVFHPYRGAMVRMLSAEEVADIYAFRTLVESELLRLAGGRLRSHDLAELRARADELTAEGNAIAWIQGRHRLYDYLYGFAERPLMRALVADTRQRVGPYLILRDIDTAQRQSRHMAIIRHLENDDVASAVDALQMHLASISDELQRLVADMAPQLLRARRPSPVGQSSTVIDTDRLAVQTHEGG